jgi:hypothetical protein
MIMSGVQDWMPAIRFKKRSGAVRRHTADLRCQTAHGTIKKLDVRIFHIDGYGLKMKINPHFICSLTDEDLTP